jgi:response regulator RpfG family c-di-GMP phosphodiesterase
MIWTHASKAWEVEVAALLRADVMLQALLKCSRAMKKTGRDNSRYAVESAPLFNQNRMDEDMNKETALPGHAATLLFIDDDASTLTLLTRLFQPLGYNIFTANSGADALLLLQKEKVDLVISDMQMPQMSGVELLEQIRLKWPDVVRILQTGHSSLSTAIEAINRGEIYRYITKPWINSDIMLIVRDALERQHLLAEKQRLEALTVHQNEELKTLNANLEDKVRQRTEELRVAGIAYTFARTSEKRLLRHYPGIRQPDGAAQRHYGRTFTARCATLPQHRAQDDAAANRNPEHRDCRSAAQHRQDWPA